MTTLFLNANRTSIGIQLLEDGKTVHFDVIANGDQAGESSLVLSGNAYIGDCDLTLTPMDGAPMLGLGLNVVPLADIETMRMVAEHLGLPMPAMHPGFCDSQQSMPA